MKLVKGQIEKKEMSVKAEDLGERSVLFVISKEVIDRDGDILRADGVDFTNFAKNPVFLPFHDRWDFPLGKVTKYWVEDDAVKAIVYFPTLEELSSEPALASEKAKLVDFAYHCYKNGMLNAVSVGFIPIEYKETKTGYDIIKWELLEFSAVAVPANQDAIAEARKSFGAEFAKDFVTETKSGKKISAETRSVLDKIKACGDKFEEVEKMLKACRDEMRELLAELDDDPDTDEEPEENHDDGKSFDLAKIKTEINLAEIK